jgi:hypothetical protein
MKKIVAASAAALLGLGVLTGCSSFTEPYNDAPVKSKNDGPAEVYSMPDGFANFASKCDSHGNRVYTTRTDGGEALAVVANDPSCEGLKK